MLKVVDLDCLRTNDFVKYLDIEMARLKFPHFNTIKLQLPV